MSDNTGVMSDNTGVMSDNTGVMSGNIIPAKQWLFHTNF